MPRSDVLGVHDDEVEPRMQLVQILERGLASRVAVLAQLREDFRQIPDLLSQPLPEPEPLVQEREPEPDQMGLFGG